MFGQRKSILPRFGVAGGAFAIAIGIGFVMQQGDSAHLTAMYAQADTAVYEIDSLPQVVGRTSPSQPMASSVDTAADLQDLLQGQMARFQPNVPTVVSGLAEQLTGIQMTSSDASVSMGDVTLSAPKPSFIPQPVLQAAPTDIDCDPRLSAVSGDAAMIDLDVVAPCHMNARVTLHHEGMMFTIQTDARGMAQVQMPALSSKSVVVAAFADGAGAVADVDAPSLNFFDRVVLQWQGNTGLQIHAFEDGATYNQAGHVWSGQPNRIVNAASGNGGFVKQLGDPFVDNPLLAEVYTFPSGLALDVDSVEMTVEAEVTRQNCERSVSAQTLQYGPDFGLTIKDLTFAIPSCQAIGEFLILNNLLEPVLIAQR